MPPFGHYLLCNVHPDAHCVDYHCRTCYLKSVKKTGDGGYLVVLAPHLLLTDEERVLGHESVEQVVTLRTMRIIVKRFIMIFS